MVPDPPTNFARVGARLGRERGGRPRTHYLDEWVRVHWRRLACRVVDGIDLYGLAALDATSV